MAAWDQQGTETPAAFQAFIAFRDLGPGRSFSAACQQLGRPTTYRRQLSRWSTKHGWPERAAAWDAHLQGERDEVLVDQVRVGQERLRDRLPEFLSRAEAIALGQAETTGAQARVLLGLIDRAGLPAVRRVDHTSGGESLSRPVDVSQLSDEALEELQRAVGLEDGEDGDDR